MSNIQWVLAVALALAISPAWSLAQERGTITGTVVDQATRRPLAGAQITVPGTTLGTLANQQGRFLIPNVPAGNREVRASLIGYSATTQTATVPAGGSATVEFELAQTAVALDEVVVTGTAGRQERRAQAAVVANVNAADIVARAPVSSVSDILAARTPGVSMNQASGTAGTGQRIRIRGAASISLSNEPLVFIDGVRADSRLQEFSYVGGQFTSRLNDINPEDIESIEIVKGPAAATLYGADASAGVIQIITKRGRAGTDRFTQSVTAEYHSIPNTYTPPANFAECTAAMIRSDTTTFRPICAGRQAGDIVSDNPLVRYGVFRDGDFRSVGWTGRGGGQNYGYFLSLGADQENGVLPNNEYGRYTGRVNFDFIPSPRWRIEAGFGLTRTQTDLPINDNNIYGFMGGGLLGNALNVGLASDGWYAPFRTSTAVSSIENSSRILRSTPTMQINFTPTEWFSNRLTLGGDITRAEAWQFYPRNDSIWYAGDLNTGQIDDIRQNSDRWTIDYLGNIRSALMDGRLSSDFSFGTQVIVIRTDQLSGTGTGLATNEARNVAAAAQRSSSGDFNEQRSVGVLGQWQLGWQDRLFLQLGARLDQNSAFGAETDPFFLPKVGVSYVISEEPFWEPILPYVNTFRLRGAWGTTGRSPTPGASLETYNPSPFAIIGGQRSGVVPLNPGNFDLEPELGTEIEAGFEAGFLNGRLGLELTYFDKTTTNLLLRRPLPPSQGFTENPFVNIGEVVNRGVEIAANARLLDLPNFGWDARLAMNTLHNELIDLGEVEPFGTLNRFDEGYQLGSFFTRRIRRVGTSEAECPQPTSATAPRRTECAIVSDDIEFMGNFLPTNEGSFTSTFTLFRNLSLTGLLDWRRDFYIYNNTDQFRERQFRTGERWVSQAQLPAEERVRRFGPFFTEEGAAVSSGVVNEAYIEDGSFLRLREVAATFMLPTQFASRFGASGASLTLGGRNLRVWSDYSGPDADVISDQAGQFTRSDFLTIPQMRRWTARLNFQF